MPTVVSSRPRGSSVVDENGGRIPNPYFAEIEFQIGDMDLNKLPPEHIQSFECQRNTDSSSGEYNKFNLSVFDATGIEIERRIAEGYQNCKFRYGYAGGAKSSMFQAEITNYDVDFIQGTCILNIEGISTGIASMGIPRTNTYKNGTISDYIEEIAKEEEWEIGYIEPTAEVIDDAGNPKSYVRANSDAITFITHTLIPESKSADTGMSGYLLYFEDKNDKTYVYYCTPNFDDDTSKAVGTDELDIFSSKESYKFTYGSDSRNSTVISFNPQFSGIITAVQGSKEVVASSVDPIRNEMYSVSIKGTVKNADGSNTNIINNDKDYKAVINSSSCSYDELRNMALNMLYSTTAKGYTATMTIIGNPQIYPQRNCDVLVILSNGLPHHSSGEYLITGITDRIEGGSYTTELALIKSGLIVEVESATVSENSDYTSTTSVGNGYNDGSGQGYNNSNYTNAGINNSSNTNSSDTSSSSGNSNILNSSAYANAVKVGTVNSINKVLNLLLEGGHSVSKDGSSINGNTGTAGCFNTDIIRVAAGEIGYKEGANNNTKYGEYTGTNYQPWCAAFVSWCANKAGVPASVIPKYASCTVGMNWFKNKSRFGNRGSYTPMEGDIIFFGSSSKSTHTGIVEGCKDGKVYTIEGNSSDQVIRRNYNLNNSKIVGYGSPNYNHLVSNSNFTGASSIECDEVIDDYSGGSGTSYPTTNAIGQHSDEDFRYLAAVISAEAYEKPVEGQYAVGYCVMNRVNDSRFPDSVAKVVSQEGQFVSPWKKYLNNPKESAAKAAKAVLNGSAENPIGSCLFFLSAATTKRQGKNVGGNLFFEEW